MDYRSLRNKAGLSLNDVATRTGFSKSQVVKVESGEISPSVRYQEAFLRALELNDTPLEDQQPITRLVHELGARQGKAKAIIADIKPALQKTGDLIQTLNAMIDLVDTIAKHQGQDSSSITDLREATDEEQAKALDEITTAIINVLKKWNIHKLSETEQKGTVNFIIGKVLEKL